MQCGIEVSLTDARGDGRAALLVALCTAVTGDSRHSVLAGALACRLVTCFPCCSNWMAIACYGGKEGEKKGEKKKAQEHQTLLYPSKQLVS